MLFGIGTESEMRCRASLCIVLAAMSRTFINKVNTISIRSANPRDVDVLVQPMNEFYAESGHQLDHHRAAVVFAELLTESLSNERDLVYHVHAVSQRLVHRTALRHLC